MVEHRSPKPGVGGSSPSTPATRPPRPGVQQPSRAHITDGIHQSSRAFSAQVRQEVSKVTWPTRKETMVTTSMVFVMVVIAALFFLLVDQIASRWAVRTMLPCLGV